MSTETLSTAAANPSLVPDLIGLPNLMGAPTARPRLLVVDDQPVNVQALYQVFAADHQVFMATSGEQALNVCRNKLPDVVLLDVVMPGMDGHAVCRALKADALTRDIPVIFVTAHTDTAAEEAGLALGAVDFISKPLRPSIVRARVKTQVTLKRQSDALRELVYLDGLTGVHNRRYFDERFDLECRRAERSGAPVSLAMIDVDHFKRYNDHYGHQRGDDCLRLVARSLRESLRRPADLVARYGGEEFVCVLPETDLAGAQGLCTLIEQRIRELAIEHAMSPHDARIVTVSIGVCTKSPQATASAVELLAMADRQLYEAKTSGRARVCSNQLD